MNRNIIQLVVLALLMSVPLSVVLAAAPERSLQIRADSLPLVRTIDERFQSFQLGFSHLTGGDTWVSYENMTPEAVKERQYTGDLSHVREPRAPTDLANPRFRKLVSALAPLYIRYGGTIDEKTFMPNADYWAALLWRKLVGTHVLDAGPIKQGLHVYAHCLRGTPGGVTVMAINLQKATAELNVAGPAELRAELYALTAPELQSKTVLLNGEALALGPNDALPVLQPKLMTTSNITLAPTSVNFIALPDAKNPYCGTRS